MNCFNEEQLYRISRIIKEIEKLSDVEKLFLYIQLPYGRVEGTEGKSKLNGQKSDLFSKKPDQETTQTYTWILSHLEVDPNVSLPKQEVYDEYKAFCQANRFEPLCVADFGKAMKHAFPCIKPRRLGQRGNSRYCYSGLRKKYKIQPPNLPDMIEPTFCVDNDCSQAYNQIIKDCLDYPNECPLNRPQIASYEVMNLKIDQNLQDGQFQSNGNGDHPVKHSDMKCRARTSQPASSASASQFNPNECIVSSPASQGASSRFNYSGPIQQPGTPDDDDYRHNYQYMLPRDKQLFAAALPVPTSQGSGPSTPTNFVYQQSTPKVADSIRTEDRSTNKMVTNTVISSSNLEASPGEGLISGTQSHFGVMNNQTLQAPVGFAHMNNPHMDSCASPFQSPASTPYPSMMGSYITQDIQDYYPSDCIRYPNS